jgi:serine/threonine protein kinase
MPNVSDLASSPSASVVRIVGRYALHRPLASGGMATVHLGRLLGSVGFARTVAIKRLHEAYANDPEFVSMFLDEARLVARIHHPNVVPTLDVVAAEGHLLLVMDYVQGESLASLMKTVLARSEVVKRPIVASIAAGMLHGLHAAHEAKNERGEPLGIVHRDVSPQNVLVGTDGVTRVLDFGVAKAAGRLRTTSDGSVRGKFAYMAPEQVRGEDVDRRTDVYSASVVVWEMLVGRRLFSAENQAALLERVMHEAVKPPSAVAPDVPPALDAIVMRGLARERTARFETAREMALAIEEALVPATAAQVGLWVEHSAGDMLAARAAMVDELDSSLPPDSHHARRLVAEMSSSREKPDLPPSPNSAPTAVDRAVDRAVDSTMPGSEKPLTESRPAAGGRGRGALLWGMLAGGGAVAVILAVILVGRSHRADAPTLTGGPPSVSQSVIDASQSAAPPAVSTPEPSTAAATTQVAAPTSSLQRRSGISPVRPPPDDCNPPYTIDSYGDKHFKEKCLPRAPAHP